MDGTRGRKVWIKHCASDECGKEFKTIEKKKTHCGDASISGTCAYYNSLAAMRAKTKAGGNKPVLKEVVKKVIKPRAMGLTPSQQEKIDIKNHNRKGYTTIYTVRNFVALFAVVVVYYLVELKI